MASLAVLLIGLTLPSPAGVAELGLTEDQKAVRALRAKVLRPGLPVEALFDRCVPTLKCDCGRFTTYTFQRIPGYDGLEFIAYDGVLVRAEAWSCTSSYRYFDAMTDDWEQAYRAARQRYDHIPPERFLGRWGWSRPPRRMWDR